MKPSTNFLRIAGLTLVFFLFLNLSFAQEIARFKAHQRSKGLNEAVISPKSNFILTAGEDSTAQLWDLSGKLLHTFKHEKENVKAIAFSPDEKLIATGGDDEKVNVWQVNNKKLAYTLTLENTIMDLQFSPDGKYLVVSEQTKHLMVYEAQKGKFIKEFPIKANSVSKIAISPQSDEIIAAWGFGLNYYTFPEGNPITVFDDLQFETDAIQPNKSNKALFSPDGKHLLTWQAGDFNNVEYNRMHKWNPADAIHEQSYKGLVGAFEVAYSHDGKYLLMGGDDWQDKDFSKNTGTLHLLEAETGKALGEIQAHKLGITSIDFSADGKYLLTAGGDNREVIIWDAPKILALRNATSQTSTNKSIENTTKNEKNTKTESIDLEDIDLTMPDAKYYALIINVGEYKDPKIKNLDSPQKDAIKLKNTLEKMYSFDTALSVHLNNPTRADIITELDKLSRKVTEDDNLLIFYAGHGYWDEDLQQGYWLPTDAQADYRANWLANSELGNYITGIKSKHTLLITDACFSGSIFENTRNAFDNAPQHIQNLYDRSSRKAMTSGMKEEVPDKSVFLEYLVKGLEENKKKYLTAGELFNFIIEPVLSNTKNAPQYGVIRNTKHEGGDFIFVKKQ